MTQPTPYRRGYDFSDAGGAQPPGGPLDGELDDIGRTLREVLRNLALLQRDDTALRNGIVGIEALDNRVLGLISGGTFSIAGQWVTATAYPAGTFFSDNQSAYLSMEAHTSTSIVDDLAAGTIVKVFQSEQGSRVRDDFTGNGVQTAFTLSQTVTSQTDVEVYVDGALVPSADYSQVGPILTFDVAPAFGAVISAFSIMWDTTPPLGVFVAAAEAAVADANAAAAAAQAAVTTTVKLDVASGVFAGPGWSGLGTDSVYIGDLAGAGIAAPSGGLTNAQGIIAIGNGALQNGPFKSDYAIFIGDLSGHNATSGYCTTAVGLRTGMSLAGGQYNSFFGCDAGKDVTTGAENVFVGAKAGLFGTTISYCVAIGSSALYNSTTALDAIAIGALAGFENISGGRFVAIGTRALEKNTVNSFSIAIGYYALRLATASGNTVVGYQGAAGTTTGSSITAMGADVLAANDNGSNIVAIGSSAAYWNVSGGLFVAIGRQAGYFNTAGSYVAIGDLAAYGTTTGSAFVAVGRGAAGITTTGSQWVAIGDGALGSNIVGNSSVAIGFQAVASATASSQLGIGWRALFNVTSGAGNVGIGEATGSTGATGAVAVTTGVFNLFGGFQASALSSGTSHGVALGRDALVGSNGVALGAYAAANDNAIAIGRGAAAATATGATSAHKAAELSIGSAAYPVGVRGDGSIHPTSGAAAGFMELELNGTTYKVQLMAA